MNKKPYLMVLGTISELVILVVAFVFAGRIIDQKFNLPGYAMTAGGILAMFLWVFHLILIIKIKERDERSSKNSKN